VHKRPAANFNESELPSPGAGFVHLSRALLEVVFISDGPSIPKKY